MRRTINIDLKCRVKYHPKTTSDCEKGIATINFLQVRFFFGGGGGGGGGGFRVPRGILRFPTQFNVVTGVAFFDNLQFRMRS